MPVAKLKILFTNNSEEYIATSLKIKIQNDLLAVDFTI